jgi:hypothetical protein
MKAVTARGWVRRETPRDRLFERWRELTPDDPEYWAVVAQLVVLDETLEEGKGNE